MGQCVAIVWMGLTRRACAIRYYLFGSQKDRWPFRLKANFYALLFNNPATCRVCSNEPTATTTIAIDMLLLLSPQHQPQYTTRQQWQQQIEKWLNFLLFDDRHDINIEIIAERAPHHLLFTHTDILWKPAHFGFHDLFATLTHCLLSIALCSHALVFIHFHVLLLPLCCVCFLSSFFPHGPLFRCDTHSHTCVAYLNTVSIARSNCKCYTWLDSLFILTVNCWIVVACVWNEIHNNSTRNMVCSWFRFEFVAVS